jgi:hypothetical protein
MNRRRFLTVIAASGSGLLLSACDDIPASAVAPWQGPPVDERDIRVRALAWALLAPNPHNLQPWLADVRVADTITLSLDPQWSLPGTDPYGRQILIGCGGFVELLRMAAAQEGYAAQIAWFPEGVFGERLADLMGLAQAVPFQRMDRRFDAALLGHGAACVRVSKRGKVPLGQGQG